MRQITQNKGAIVGNSRAEIAVVVFTRISELAKIRMQPQKFDSKVLPFCAPKMMLFLNNTQNFLWKKEFCAPKVVPPACGTRVARPLIASCIASWQILTSTTRYFSDFHLGHRPVAALLRHWCNNTIWFIILTFWLQKKATRKSNRL